MLRLILQIPFAVDSGRFNFSHLIIHELFKMCHLVHANKTVQCTTEQIPSKGVWRMQIKINTYI